jgi:Ino eighty subunit 1
MSDLDQQSSPVGQGNDYGHEHSFVNHTEDEDTRMDHHLPRLGKPHRSRPSTGPKRGGSEPNKDASNIGKVKHLKKEDGEPLWRKDIQYDFLKAVFDNDLKVFTNSYEPNLPKQCFADLYIDTMSRSSKTSKVLRDKLLSDREAAKGMAMVCLLVNIGRMNTTLNCEYNPRRVASPWEVAIH